MPQPEPQGLPEEEELAERESAGALCVPPSEIVRLEAWAAAGFPHEVCGLLTGRRRDGAAEVVRATRARNLRRDRPGDRYELDPDDFLAEDRRARRDGLDILGFWHTHPDHPARPSSTDLETAWPGYAYLIITATATGTGDFRCWQLEGGRFVELTLRTEEIPP